MNCLESVENFGIGSETAFEIVELLVVLSGTKT